jgi:hypothetical protein
MMWRGSKRLARQRRVDDDELIFAMRDSRATDRRLF